MDGSGNERIRTALLAAGLGILVCGVGVLAFRKPDSSTVRDRLDGLGDELVERAENFYGSLCGRLDKLKAETASGRIPDDGTRRRVQGELRAILETSQELIGSQIRRLDTLSED